MAAVLGLGAAKRPWTDGGGMVVVAIVEMGSVTELQRHGWVQKRRRWSGYFTTIHATTSTPSYMATNPTTTA